MADFLFEYDNIQDYYKECMKPRTTHHKDSITNDEFFSGSKSFEETLERYNKGYPEGTSKARTLLMQLTPFLRTVQGVKSGWSPQRYAGGNFILNNYVRGIPELCNVMSPIVSKKFCSIILNQTASCGVSTEVMLKRGITALALALMLEQNGYRVSVKVAYGERGKNETCMYTIVNLKAFNQTLEVDRLAFFLADPSSFRRLNFAFMETRSEPLNTDILDRSYGSPIDLKKEMIGDKDIYLTKANFNYEYWHSLEGTKAFLKETLKRYGIEMHG